MKRLTFLLLLASCTGAGSHAAACDWSEHESDNEPGCAYREGKAAAEDADCHEDHED